MNRLHFSFPYAWMPTVSTWVFLDHRSGRKREQAIWLLTVDSDQTLNAM